MKKLLLALSLGVMIAPQVVKAEPHGHDRCLLAVDRVAVQLERSVPHLADTLRSAGANEHIMSVARELEEMVEHLHEHVHTARSCRELRSDADEIKELVQHLQQDVNQDHRLRFHHHVRIDLFQVQSQVIQLQAAFRIIPPPVHPTVTNISLGSSQYRYNSTTVPGTITGVRLLQQQSGAACIQGRSFGAQGNTLWVDRGCRGLFQVTYVR